MKNRFTKDEWKSLALLALSEDEVNHKILKSYGLRKHEINYLVDFIANNMLEDEYRYISKKLTNIFNYWSLNFSIIGYTPAYFQGLHPHTESVSRMLLFDKIKTKDFKLMINKKYKKL